MNNNFFLFDGRVFQQVEGAPMGSRLGPVLANIHMEWFESEALTGGVVPRIWWRYVDDIFCIWQHSQIQIDQFLDHLNSIEPPI